MAEPDLAGSVTRQRASRLTSTIGVHYAYCSEQFPSALQPSHPQPSSSKDKLLALALMSQIRHTAASSSNFQLLINSALDKYKERTKNDLRAHPLAAQLQSCDSPSAILAVLQEQVQGLDQSRSDEQWTKWLDPTVNVLYVFSSILGSGVSLVCFRSFACLRSALSYLCGSYFPLRASSLPGSESSFQCVFFI